MSNFGLAFDYVLMALAPSLGWLFLGRVISGITTASVSTAFAYIADVTAPEKRAQAFGLIGAAFGAGFILGPAVGGLLGGIDPRLPFWLAAGFSFANAMYGLFVLPESLPRERRAPFRWQNANPVGSLKLLRVQHRPDRSGHRQLHLAARACGAAERVRALRRLSLQLGCDHGRHHAGDRRRLLDGGAGRPDRAVREAVRRAAIGPVRLRLRRDRLCDLCAGADRLPVLARHSAAGDVGPFQSVDPVADEPRRQPDASRGNCRAPTPAWRAWPSSSARASLR